MASVFLFLCPFFFEELILTAATNVRDDIATKTGTANALAIYSRGISIVGS